MTTEKEGAPVICPSVKKCTHIEKCDGHNIPHELNSRDAGCSTACYPFEYPNDTKARPCEEAKSNDQ